MSKKLLRFCVLIYKGLLFIVEIFKKIFGFILKKGNDKNYIDKAKVKIEKEKKKQQQFREKEEQRLEKEKIKKEKIAKREQQKEEQKQLRIKQNEERKVQRMQIKAEKQRKKNAKKQLKKLPEKSDKHKPQTEEQILTEQAKLEKFATKLQIRLAKDKRGEKELKEQLEKENKKKKRKYRNEMVTVNKLTFAERISNYLKNLNESPIELENYLREKWNNTSFARNRKNKLDLNRKALLIEFENKEAERSNVKILYEYIVKDKNGKIIKGYADGYSKVEIHSYLLSEGYEVYSIRTNKWIQTLHSNSSINKIKIKNKDLVFFLTQLSTYLKAGITLIEALKILSRQYKKKTYKKIFKMIIYDLSMGENFSTALENRGLAFPNLLITMAKSAEMTGELPEVLDDLSDYYTEVEKTRKQMVTAMMYPSFVFVFAISVLTFIMIYVIPKFVDIYDSMDGVEIPSLTQFVINVSNFTQKNIIYMIIAVILLFLGLRQLYIKYKPFRVVIQWFLMHLPVVKNIIIYKEVTLFTKTFSSLLSHNVYITDSMEILSKATKNEIYKTLIFNTVANLARGERLSAEFEGHWAFPIPAYEMILTGERTGQLPEMMSKVSTYYQELHQNSVTRIKAFIEPVLIIFLTVMVGIIVLSIVLPMFSMYQSISNLGGM